MSAPIPLLSDPRLSEVCRRPGFSFMTAEEVAEARSRYEAGESVKAIARSMGRAPSSIGNKLRGLPKHVQHAPSAIASERNGLNPLPAGSATTWGLISNKPWPGERG